MPLVSPVTVSGLTAPVVVKPPGLEVAVKSNIGLPPVAPGVKVTVACVLPAVAVPIVGAAGTVTTAGVTALEAADAGPVPATLVAVTVKV